MFLLYKSANSKALVLSRLVTGFWPIRFPDKKMNSKLHCFLSIIYVQYFAFVFYSYPIFKIVVDTFYQIPNLSDVV